MAEINTGFLKKLRILGAVEAISTLALFGVAMPLKYAAGIPLAVSIVGPIHGLLFVSLATMLLIGMGQVPMSGRLAAGGIVAALFPFGPFVYDRWLVALAETETPDAEPA